MSTEIRPTGNILFPVQINARLKEIKEDLDRLYAEEGALRRLLSFYAENLTEEEKKQYRPECEMLEEELPKMEVVDTPQPVFPTALTKKDLRTEHLAAKDFINGSFVMGDKISIHKDYGYGIITTEQTFQKEGIYSLQDALKTEKTLEDMHQRMLAFLEPLPVRMTVSEVAAAISVNRTKVYRMIRDGDLIAATENAGGPWMISKGALAQMILEKHPEFFPGKKKEVGKRKR